jgi:polar amino acid transport system substrate-binding protein
MNNHHDRTPPRAGILGTTLLAMMLLMASPLAGQNLKIFGSEHPPYSYLKDGRPTGLCADIVRALLDDLDLRQEITIAPWARSYKTALEEPNVLLFTVARTAEREPLFHWVGVIVSGETHLYGLRDRDDIVINRLDQAQRYKIGVVRDDIRAGFLRKNGFTDLDEVTGSEINARKLAMGWIDLWVEEENAAPFVFEKLGLNPGEKLKKVYTLDLRLDGYLAFSRDSDPELVARFRAALDRLKGSGEYARLLATYDNLPDP